MFSPARRAAQHGGAAGMEVQEEQQHQQQHQQHQQQQQPGFGYVLPGFQQPGQPGQPGGGQAGWPA
jgi:hypothetical protein